MNAKLSKQLKQVNENKLSLQLPGSKNFFTIDKNFFTQDPLEPKAKESKTITRIDDINPVIGLLDHRTLEKYINNCLDGDFYYKVIRAIYTGNDNVPSFTFIEHDTYLNADLIKLQMQDIVKNLLSITLKEVMDVASIE